MSTSHFADFRSALFVTSSLQVLNLVLRFVLSLFLARALGVEGRGELALALTLPIFFHVVLYLGLGEANTYLIGKGRFDAKLIVGSLNSLALLLIILSAVAYFALAGQLISLLKANISQTTYYWAYPIIPLTLVWSHWAANLMGLGLVKKVGLGRVLNTATYLGASVVLVVFLSRHVRGALEGYILGQAVELVFIWRLLKRSVPLGLCWRRDVMKEQLSFGAKNSLGAALNYVNLRADVFFVNWFAGTEGLGIYTVAVGFAELILNIPQILSRVVLSFASEAKDKQGWLLAAHGARLGLLVMGCLVIPMAIFMEPLIHVLYSARFGAAMLPCLVLLPGVVALGFAIILA
ncbi:MAG: oligosaccharide flippase family protein, partial [Deltaproteobacteria bacterium]|nr:oligosaccharide flippase family protein [Deltaproteobacteria bacterium]